MSPGTDLGALYSACVTVGETAAFFPSAPSMPTLTVRQAVFADLDALAELFDRYRLSQGQQSALPAARAFLKARFDHGESVVFLAHDASSAPLGFAQLYPSYSSTAMARVFILNDLYVHERGRRRGVASALLSAVEAYAASHGAVRVTLNVDQGNLPGQQLYEARGWRRDAQFFMYHRFPDADGKCELDVPAAGVALPP